MKKNDELMEVLTDLIRINNDRIEGYQKAIDETKPENQDLMKEFHHMIDESRQNRKDLEEAMLLDGGTPEKLGTTGGGKIYRAWMDVRAAFSSKNNKRETVLESCEFGEDAAQKAYQRALDSDIVMKPGIQQLILNQQATLKASHDRIRAQRDAARANS